MGLDYSFYYYWHYQQTMINYYILIFLLDVDPLTSQQILLFSPSGETILQKLLLTIDYTLTFI